MFNLVSDGVVQLIYPLAPDGDDRLDDAMRQSLLATVVVPPFGVDHLVALATPEVPQALLAALRNADGQRTAGGLAGLIRDELQARARQGLAIDCRAVYRQLTRLWPRPVRSRH